MDWEVISVELAGPHRIRVAFRDGLQGEVEFLSSFFVGVFEPLKDPQRFAEVRLGDGFVTWPGDLDLAPDAMHAGLQRNQDLALA
jgi:hypothetical protein